MKIILLQDIKSLGKKGDSKDVSEGYARNFLFPKKIAVLATEVAIKNVEEKRKKEVEEKQKETAKLTELAHILKDKKIVLKYKAKKGKLFGSVSARDIAKELEKENYNVSEKMVKLKDPIKKIGTYSVKLELAPNIISQISLSIEEA
ncbi:MAG TPA: 50S ribosomal protein L9 [Candidatus Moranbacteria bacterium]|nr:50S ribosomal protein L9 [Candidatus Moranbacteria bacterium]